MEKEIKQNFFVNKTKYSNKEIEDKIELFLKTKENVALVKELKDGNLSKELFFDKIKDSLRKDKDSLVLMSYFTNDFKENIEHVFSDLFILNNNKKIIFNKDSKNALLTKLNLNKLDSKSEDYCDKIENVLFSLNQIYLKNELFTEKTKNELLEYIYKSIIRNIENGSDKREVNDLNIYIKNELFDVLFNDLEKNEDKIEYKINILSNIDRYIDKLIEYYSFKNDSSSINKILTGKYLEIDLSNVKNKKLIQKKEEMKLNNSLDTVSLNTLLKVVANEVIIKEINLENIEKLIKKQLVKRLSESYLSITEFNGVIDIYKKIYKKEDVSKKMQEFFDYIKTDFPDVFEKYKYLFIDYLWTNQATNEIKTKVKTELEKITKVSKYIKEYNLLKSDKEEDIKVQKEQNYILVFNCLKEIYGEDFDLTKDEVGYALNQELYKHKDTKEKIDVLSQKSKHENKKFFKTDDYNKNISMINLDKEKNEENATTVMALGNNENYNESDLIYLNNKTTFNEYIKNVIKLDIINLLDYKMFKDIFLKYGAYSNLSTPSLIELLVENKDSNSSKFFKEMLINEIIKEKYEIKDITYIKRLFDFLVFTILNNKKNKKEYLKMLSGFLEIYKNNKYILNELKIELALSKGVCDVERKNNEKEESKKEEVKEIYSILYSFDNGLEKDLDVNEKIFKDIKRYLKLGKDDRLFSGENIFNIFESQFKKLLDDKDYSLDDIKNIVFNVLKNDLFSSDRSKSSAAKEVLNKTGKLDGNVIDKKYILDGWSYIDFLEKRYIELFEISDLDAKKDNKIKLKKDIKKELVDLLLNIDNEIYEGKFLKDNKEWLEKRIKELKSIELVQELSKELLKEEYNKNLDFKNQCIYLLKNKENELKLVENVGVKSISMSEESTKEEKQQGMIDLKTLFPLCENIVEEENVKDRKIASKSSKI
jgi:hypothetical protein